MTGASCASPSPTLLLPHTNLPKNLPLFQNEPTHNFSVKDQHLLKPPPVMGAVGGFGRRASDGGANLQNFFQKNIENSDWTVQQHQQTQQLEKHYHEAQSTQHGQNDPLHHLNPAHLNGHSTSSHISLGMPSTEALEDTQNSHDLAR